MTQTTKAAAATPKDWGTNAVRFHNFTPKNGVTHDEDGFVRALRNKDTRLTNAALPKVEAALARLSPDARASALHPFRSLQAHALRRNFEARGGNAIPAGVLAIRLAQVPCSFNDKET